MSAELESVAEFLTGSRLGVRTLPWRLLGSEDLRVLREWAGETMSPPAQKRLLRELREAMSLASDEETGPETSGIEPRLLRASLRTPPPIGVATRPAKLLLDSCEGDESIKGRRDFAIVTLMLLAGLRRKEVVELQRGDYDEEDARLRIASRNRHARSVILEGLSCLAVEHWIAARGSWSGPLIAALNADGEVVMKGVSVAAINRLLGKRCRDSGLTGITPRDLRRRFVAQLQTLARERPRCRYFQDENGRPSWVLPAIAAL